MTDRAPNTLRQYDLTLVDVVLAEPAWPDLGERIEAAELAVVEDRHAVAGLTVLMGGATSGDPAIALRINDDNGDVVVLQFSLNLWRMMRGAIRGALPLHEDL